MAPKLYTSNFENLRDGAAHSFGPKLPRACTKFAEECRDAEKLFVKLLDEAKDSREAFVAWHPGGVEPNVFEEYVTRGLYVHKTSDSDAKRDWTLCFLKYARVSLASGPLRDKLSDYIEDLQHDLADDERPAKTRDLLTCKLMPITCWFEDYFCEAHPELSRVCGIIEDMKLQDRWQDLFDAVTRIRNDRELNLKGFVGPCKHPEDKDEDEEEDEDEDEEEDGDEEDDEEDEEDEDEEEDED